MATKRGDPRLRASPVHAIMAVEGDRDAVHERAAAKRRARCVELVSRGWRYEDIAREVGYATRGAVSKAVHRALRERAVDAVDEFRALEIARLDALQVAVWEQAMAGDVKAATTVLRIIDRRIKLLGLGEHAADPAPAEAPALVDPAYLEPHH